MTPTIYEVVWGRAGSPLHSYRFEEDLEKAKGRVYELLQVWANPGDVVAILEYKVWEVREIFRQVKGPSL